MDKYLTFSSVNRALYCKIVKSELKKRKITQEVFATEYLHIKFGTFKNYIKPNATEWPPLCVWFDMCNALECDSDYLLGLQPHPRKETTDICSVTGLSPAAVAALKARKRDQDDAFASELPGTLELKALNCILEHGQDDDGYMKSTIFSHIGYILFSHFVDARLSTSEDRKIPLPGSDKYRISPSGKDKITFYDEISGAFTEFRIEDLNLSQMENIRKSIYLLKDELDKQNRPTK